MFSSVSIDPKRTKDLFGYEPSELPNGSHSKVVVVCNCCSRVIHREFRNVKAKHQCPVVDGNKKRCFKCGDWKDLTLFNKAPKLSGGVAKMCRSCFNAHPSVVKTEQQRRFNLRHLLKNGEMDKYIRLRTSQIKSQAKINSIPFNITAEQLIEQWNKQNGLCYYSSMPMSASLKQAGFQAWDAPSLDRKTPSLGYVAGNLVWCLFAVNSFKQSLHEDRFVELVNSITWRKE
jgi:hypothetical protein